LLGVLFLGSSANPQRDRPTDAPGKLEIAKHPLVLEPPVGPQTKKLDPVKLHEEAEELVKLAQSVPEDIGQIAQGKISKDFIEKLKRIEKLSKRLRGELVP
jgi:hypothetical protein